MGPETGILKIIYNMDDTYLSLAPFLTSGPDALNFDPVFKEPSLTKRSRASRDERALSPSWDPETGYYHCNGKNFPNKYLRYTDIAIPYETQSSL